MPGNVIQIPLSCPKCCGKLIAVKYVTSLRVLKERCWHICKRCGFERDVEDFKRNLFSI